MKIFKLFARSYKFCLFLFSAPLFGGETICLNMIVKNEESVIEECLLSVKPMIDYWVIVDTGSTDKTKKIILETLKNIPGELHEKPWINFAHNRNEALQLAKNKGDYIFFIDADEKLIFSKRPKLDKDSYLVTIHQDATRYQRTLLINNHIDWKWEGILHEGLVSKEAKTREWLSDLLVIGDSKKGFRTQDPEKFAKDAKILEDILKKEPENSRVVFYLAQSYLHSDQYEKAHEFFKKRSTMGGDEGEVFWSLYKAGSLEEELKKPSSDIIASYSKAYLTRPTRAEPLFRLASHYFDIGNFILAKLVAEYALTLPMPENEIIYVEYPVYDHLLHFTLANSLFGLGKLEEACAIYESLLKKPHLFGDTRERIENNLKVTKSLLK